MPNIDALIALLRRLPEISGGLVELDPGIDDARIDSWAVPVPQDIRTLLRAIGGIRIVVARSVFNGVATSEVIDFSDSFNNADQGLDVSWYAEQAGGAGSHWFVHLDSGDGHTYVDVDRKTGAWGPVFRFWDGTDTQRLALSLPDWLQQLAEHVQATLTETGAEDANVFGDAFVSRWPEPAEAPTPVAPVRAAEARCAADPVLQEAAADLPDDVLLADLRPVAGVAAVDFDLPVTCRYGRRSGGAILIAEAWDGD